MEKAEVLQALRQLQRQLRDFWETTDPGEMESQWAQIIAEMDVLIERAENELD